VKTRNCDLSRLRAFCKALNYRHLKIEPGVSIKGTLAAHLQSAQQLGSGAIVEKLSRGRSFFDGRARGEGSKGYVGKRDAHNNRKKVWQRPARLERSVESRPRTPAQRAHELAGRCFYFGLTLCHGFSRFSCLSFLFRASFG
jgi:hypothetical protein